METSRELADRIFEMLEDTVMFGGLIACLTKNEIERTKDKITKILESNKVVK